MSAGDKLSNAAQDAKGKMKEGLGSATNNESMEGEGKLDQAKAQAKGKVEDAKDQAKGGLAD